MALAPKFAGQALSFNVSPKTVHTVELYLDYVCPFSAKMFNTVYNNVLPVVEDKYKSKVQFIFRQQIPVVSVSDAVTLPVEQALESDQPRHPSSTIVHEAGVAVLRIAPDKFYEFSATLFEAQKDYFDVNVVNQTRNDTYKRLAKLASKSGIDEAKIFDLLKVSDKPGEDGSLNIGNQVTDDLKQLVKFNRRIGVHVTPTVLFNGIEDGSISSSFTGEQWSEWLSKNVT